MNTLPRTILIYLAWLAIAVLVYPLALAIPMLVHFVTQGIPITLDNIVPLTYLYGYDERTVLYFALYSGLLGIFQQIFLKRLLSIRTRWWALGTFVGGTMAMLILSTGQTPFGQSLNFAPFLFGFSVVQAGLLFRYTNWAWLWVVAHLAIAGMFPLTVNMPPLELALQWSIKAGIAGVVTMGILQVIVTRADQEAKPKRESPA